MGGSGQRGWSGPCVYDVEEAGAQWVMGQGRASMDGQGWVGTGEGMG